MNDAMLKVIRIVFTVASRVLPGPTGRAAFRLFCTTFEPRKKSAQHKAILDNAQALFNKASHHTVNYSGGTVAAFEFKPEAISNESNSDSTASLNTIWLIHGWQSHSLFMSHFVNPLLKLGFRVISIDLPGHGKSSGRTFHLPLAVSALHAVQRELGEFSMIISHSLGGAVAATTLAGTIPDHPALPIKKLVLISSPNSMEKIFDNFAAMIGLGSKSSDELHAIVKRLSGKQTNDFSTGLQLQQVSTDLLVIHAPDDKEVPYSEAEAIAQANPHASLSPMPGLGHRRIIASADVVQSAVDFVTQ